VLIGFSTHLNFPALSNDLENVHFLPTEMFALGNQIDKFISFICFIEFSSWKNNPMKPA
jgi:hypothetical protein